MSTGAAAPPPSSRAGLVGDERVAVLNAALEVAQERGYHATTAERVAQAAGVEPELVESLYANRQELLKDALELAFRQWFDEVPTWKDADPLPDLRQELDRRFRAGVGAGRRVSDFWRLGLLLRLEPALADSDCWELFVDVRERTRAALREYWCQVLPLPIADDPVLVDLAVRGHVSLVDGAILAGHATPDWDLDRMMSFVATGLSAALLREAARMEGREE